MNKQEILEEINKTEEHLANMKKMLEECDYESKGGVMFKENCTQYCENCLELQKKLEVKERELEPFKDDYFKNLDTKTIAELAKKSIRLTTENRKLEDALDEIKQYRIAEINDEEEEKNDTVLNIIRDLEDED